MKKIINLFLFFFLLSSFAPANPIEKQIKAMQFDKDTKVAFYLTDLKNGKSIYKRNENLPLNPASGLKLLTLGVSYRVLGENYEFETALYEDSENNIYLKLGGDVLLTTADLNNLLSILKDKKIKDIYIDDSIFDKNPYPSTWMEEDKWPNYPMISPYMIDSNLIQINLKRSSLAPKIDVVQNDVYEIPIINELEIGEKQDIKIERLYGDDCSIINLQGTLNKDEILNLYVLEPNINFNVRLNRALDKNGIVHNQKAGIKKTPEDAKKIASINRPISEIAKIILHDSDNIASETVFKVAASKYFQKEATLDDAIKMFMNFYGKKFKKGEQIADASGVSRQNLLSLKTYNWIMSDILKETKIIELLPTSNQGTMKDRLLFLENNLKVKTGTMKDYSSLYGIFNTRKNTKVLFSSIIQDSKKRKSILKNYENSIIGVIYKNY